MTLCVLRTIGINIVNLHTGYIKAQSVPSLAAGLTFGSILAVGAYLNSQEPPRPLLQLGTALVLGGMMGFR